MVTPRATFFRTRFFFGDCSLINASPPPSFVAVARVAAAIAIVLLFVLHLSVAFIVGMLVYVAGEHLTALVRRHTHLKRPAIVSLVLLLLLMVLVGWGIDTVTEALLSPPRTQHLLDQLAQALDRLQTSLPQSLAARIPASVEDFRAAAAVWLHAHAGQVRFWGEASLRAVAYILAGTIIGLLAMLHTAAQDVRGVESTPWLAALAERFALLEASFSAVVFAQLRIAAINTVLTAIYLLAILPLLGVHLPFTNTVLALTFVAGLVPLVGNLVSNAIIVVLSITQGLGIAALSLAFLAVIHKLEYVLNAMIVGARIHTRAFELLTVMMVFEAAFGLAGLVLAPVVYAYAKTELRAAGWLPGA